MGQMLNVIFCHYEMGHFPAQKQLRRRPIEALYEQN